MGVHLFACSTSSLSHNFVFVLINLSPSDPAEVAVRHEYSHEEVLAETCKARPG